MIRKYMTVGLEVAYSADERRETIATPTLQKATILHIGPLPRKVTIYEHPFHKMVSDGVLVRIGERELLVGPRDLLGTWDEHLIARQAGDALVAETKKQERERRRREEKNLGLLQMLVEQDKTYDFSHMKSWIKNDAAIPITPVDIYRMVNALFGLKMFDLPKEET